MKSQGRVQLHENTHYLTLDHTKVANFHLHDVANAPAKVHARIQLVMPEGIQL